MANDALGEVFTEKHGGRVVTVRRLVVPPAVAAQIIAEATAATALSGPNVLRPLEVSAEGGRVTLVTDTCEGRTLRGLLTTLAAKGEKLAVSHAAWIATRVLEALEFGHSLPGATCHGRVSPEHIVLTPLGKVRLTGFGLDAACRHLLQAGEKTDPAFAYVAPEQLTHEPLTPAADVFAVMTVLAEAVVGKPVFVEDTFERTWAAVANRPLPVLRQSRAEVPRALDEALAWALGRDPSRRCSRAGALRSKLEAFQGVLDVGDRVKPDEHPKRVADLLRLRMKGPLGASATDVTGMAPIDSSGAAVAPPETKKPGRRGLRALQLVFTALAVLFFIGVWAKWPELEEPARRMIPAAVAVQLGIEPAHVPPPEPPDASVEVPDSGEPVRDAGPPPPALKPARLTVRSTPAADVMLDGKLLGSTPLVNVAVEPGAHALELTSKPPRHELKQQLTLREGEKKALQLKLNRLYYRRF